MAERTRRLKALLQHAAGLLETERELIAAAEIDFTAVERSLQQVAAIMRELEACRDEGGAPALSPGEAVPAPTFLDEIAPEPLPLDELSVLAEKVIFLRCRNMDLLRDRMAECAGRIKEAARGKEAAAAYMGTTGLLERQPAGRSSCRKGETPPAQFLEKLR